MKTLLNKVSGRRAFRLGVSITTTLLLLPVLPATAQTNTPYTATGWVIDVPVPGIWFTNAVGQVGFRGNAHLARVVSTEPRLTGRRTIFVDGAAQADGSSIIYGPVYSEVGTWDVTGTNFTPTGGVWENTYRGTMGADGSLQLHIVGTGWGGTIDGLRLDETLTRTNGPILDPAIPYLYTGTIKPPPLNTSEVVDNFDDNLYAEHNYGSGTVLESNQQFIARGSFAGVHTTSILDSYVMGRPQSTTWDFPDGMTMEWRTDLVSLDDNATNATVFFMGTSTGGGYNFVKGLDFVFLNKLRGGAISMFACEKVALRNTDVVLAFALTWVQPNLVITTRVLDKADPNTVLYQHSVVDTPGVDSTLTTAEFEALTGMRFLDLVPDGPGAPNTSVRAALGVFQYTDGTQPAPTAIFDNLELRTSEIPLIGIERAVRLSWPAAATLNYAVEGAPTLQGPWMPVQDSLLPGVQQTTVPANDTMGFFRLRQSP